MLLNGFGFSGYRSFGDHLTKIAPLKKVNFIIGKNNIGKSNIINFLNEQYPHWKHLVESRNAPQLRHTSRQHNDFSFEETDKHISNSAYKFRISFPILNNEIEEYIKSITTNRQGSLKKIIDQLVDEKGTLWFTYESSSPKSNFIFSNPLSSEELLNIMDSREWHSLWNDITSRSGGSIQHHWIPEVMERIQTIPKKSPAVEVIPAIRKVGNSGSSASDFSGEGIIERLAKIQNPPLQQLSDKTKFAAINDFVQDVLGNKSAQIEIPYERDMILVHMDGKTLPLESLGTGVHEVVILAAAATLLTETIICVEEPELHLHPLLQKKLITYLANKTNNQYFFTTHSAHLLDAVEGEIFHVTQVNGESRVQAISSTKERASVCNDLGYKASDILQANCIIWVEGPSDRIYLNYWIKAKHPELIEGLHYSIMFYGGRLFSHLSALDNDEQAEVIEDFVSVRSLNRNSIIMFDSDKAKPQSRLTPTKKRLANEFNQGSGFTWVTKGREVENYLDFEQLEQSIQAVHTSASNITEKTIWSNLLKYKKKNSNVERTANKVKVANHYVKHYKADFSKLDLNERVNQLCSFIKNTNDM
ncbi:AAA family ATPase [Vibrio harveyi]|nr:AAA family ATPase [Vibrio harveyi]HDZ5415935.1 AAA family ATPase [Vibrio harveyi]